MKIVKPKRKKREPAVWVRPAEAWRIINDPAEPISRRMEALRALPPKTQRELAAMPLEEFYGRKFYWEVCQRAKRYACRFTCEGCDAKETLLWVRIASFAHHGNEGAHMEDLEALCEECVRRADDPKRGLRVVAGGVT